MINPRVILDQEEIAIIIKRLAHELIENHGDFASTAILGLQPRGVEFAKRIKDEISNLLPNQKILYGDLDSTFYRDDFRRSQKPLLPNEVNIEFDVEGKKIIFVDDVLYTGRSVRAALGALNAYGRPEKVELLVLIDRRYNRELPISPDYYGRVVDTRGVNERVKVEWIEGNNKVWISSNEE
jgi:pyrimidine operon attenuation protein/uracil phosphoribosyltransferase